MAAPTLDAVILRCAKCGAMNRVPVKRLTQNPLCGKCKALLDFPLKPVTVTSATFEKEMSEWPEALLIMFCSARNDDCKDVAPAVEDIAFFRAGRFKVLKLDIDADPGIALLYAVHITPTLIAFRNGRQLGRLEGAPRESSELTQWIKRTLSL
jgi:thioredoxin 2